MAKLIRSTSVNNKNKDIASIAELIKTMSFEEAVKCHNLIEGRNIQATPATLVAVSAYLAKQA